MIRMILTMLVLVALGFSCTENIRARVWGGVQTIKLPCGNRLIDVAWDDGDLWLVTRPLRSDEVPIMVTMIEDSSLGVAEGTVNIQECQKD